MSSVKVFFNLPVFIFTKINGTFKNDTEIAG